MTGRLPLIRSTRPWLALILLAHLALSVASSVVTPLGEAPDEADHWAYVVHLARERTLPVGPVMTQAKHPPLYHVTAAVVASLAEPSTDFLRSNPDVQIGAGDAIVAGRASGNFFVHTALEDWPWRGGVLAFHLTRFWSALLSTLAVWAAFSLLQLVFPGRAALALSGAGVLAFLPEFVFIGGTLNNDVAAALLGTLGLMGAMKIARAGGRLGAAWWTPVAFGLGLLSKVSTVGVWPAACLAILAGGWSARKRQGISRAWTGGLGVAFIVFGGALLCASPWLVRNWSLYGDPLGLSLAEQTVDVRSAPWTADDTLWLLRGWFVSSWGKFGGAGHIPMPGLIYRLLLALSVASGAGIVLRLVRPADRHQRRGILFLGLALAGTMLVMWRYSLFALGTDQGRLLYPAAAPLAGLLAFGWLSWTPERHRELAARMIVFLGLLLSIYGLVFVLRPAFAPPAAATIPPSASWEDRAVQFGELTLAGCQLGEHLDLYWRAAERPTQDWRVVLRLVGADGRLLWEHKRSPGAGRLATDRWPDGYIIRDSYQLDWQPGDEANARLEVGLYPFGGPLVEPVNFHSAQWRSSDGYLVLECFGGGIP